MSEIIYNTPKSKKDLPIFVPTTPSKDNKFKLFNNHELIHSKPTKIIPFKSLNIGNQIIPQQLETSKNNDNDSLDGTLSKRLLQDDMRSPSSDFESISPISDMTSPSPTIEIPEQTDASKLLSKTWNNKLDIFDNSLKLNKMITNRLFELQQSNYNNDSDIETKPIIANINHCGNTPLKKSTPKHRITKPKTKILNYNNNALNLIVSSSNGSLDDATIYATEINSSLSDHSNKIPKINNIWECVTIPVNRNIKEKHKQLRRYYFGDLYDCTKDLSSDSKSQLPDTALIRGFEYTGNIKQQPCKQRILEKHVSWTDSLNHIE